MILVFVNDRDSTVSKRHIMNNSFISNGQTYNKKSIQDMKGGLPISSLILTGGGTIQFTEEVQGVLGFYGHVF